jgi:hypothetical protein
MSDCALCVGSTSIRKLNVFEIPRHLDNPVDILSAGEIISAERDVLHCFDDLSAVDASTWSRPTQEPIRSSAFACL